MLDSGTVVIASFISPLNSDRNFIKEIIGDEDFVEVFVNTPLEVCEARDVKGFIKKPVQEKSKILQELMLLMRHPNLPILK